MADSSQHNWKLELKYGRLKTPFTHFTLIIDGIASNVEASFNCRDGRAFMAMKVWATSQDEAIDMARTIGPEIGFVVDGNIQLYDTEPEQPPGDNPHAYSINFTPYEN